MLNSTEAFQVCAESSYRTSWSCWATFFSVGKVSPWPAKNAAHLGFRGPQAYAFYWEILRLSVA